MAALEEDARKALQKRVYDLAMAGNSVKLKAQLGERPEIDVDEYKQYGRRAFLGRAQENTQHVLDCSLITADVHAGSYRGQILLYAATQMESLGCVKLLVQNGADVNCQVAEWG
jgi:hypothetical protein